jgi:Meiotically up-regulated gene 113
VVVVISQLNKIIEEKNKYIKSLGNHLPFQEKLKMQNLLDLSIGAIQEQKNVIDSSSLSLIKLNFIKYEEIFYKNNLLIPSIIRNYLKDVSGKLRVWLNQSKKTTSKSISLCPIERTKFISNIFFLRDLMECLNFKKHHLTLVDADSVSVLYSIEDIDGEIKKLINVTEGYNKLPDNLFLVKKIFNLEGKLYYYKEHFDDYIYNYRIIANKYKAKYLYFFYDVKTQLTKIGISNVSVQARYKAALDHYKKCTGKEGKLEILKIIESDNSFELEAYLKKKYKHYVAPNFSSDEWFKFNSKELKFILDSDIYASYDPVFSIIKNHNLPDIGYTTVDSNNRLSY